MNYIVLAVGLVFACVFGFTKGYVEAGIAALCLILDAVFYLRMRQKDNELIQRQALEKLTVVMREEIKVMAAEESAKASRRLREIETLLAIDSMGG